MQQVSYSAVESTVRYRCVERAMPVKHPISARRWVELLALFALMSLLWGGIAYMALALALQ